MPFWLKQIILLKKEREKKTIWLADTQSTEINHSIRALLLLYVIQLRSSVYVLLGQLDNTSQYKAHFLRN